MSRAKKKMFVLIDRLHGQGPGRGIIFAPADTISADDVNVMATHGRGLIAASLTADRAFSLGLQRMARSTDRPGTPRYLASVEAARCTETGISAAERALTLNVLGDLQSVPTDLKVPGHIMPAVVHEGVDSGSPLASTARCYVQARHQSLVVAWCDILDENGDLASADYCEALASKLGLVLLHLETCRQLLCLGRGPRIRGYSLHAGNHAMIGWQAPMSGMMDVDPMLAGVR